MEIPSRYEKNLTHQLTTTEDSIDDLHEQIFRAFFTTEPRSAEEYQQRVAALPSMLDEYDRLLAQEQDLVWKAGKLASIAKYYKMKQRIYERIIGLRREIALLVRQHVQSVLAFDPQRQTWDELLRDRRQMMQEINRRNNQINQSGFYVSRKVGFTY